MGLIPRLRGCAGTAPRPRSLPATALRQRARLLASLLTLATLTAACAPPHPAGTLIVASKARIDSLDPAQASRSGQMQVLSALGDPLSAIAADGTGSSGCAGCSGLRVFRRG